MANNVLKAKSKSGLPLLEQLKNIEMPHPLGIIFAVVALAALATYLLPGGTYQRTELDGRMIVVPGSYKTSLANPQGLLSLALVPFNGLLQAADIIILLLIIGGAFSIVKNTGALTTGIYRMTQTMKGREVILIPLLMTLFGLAGGIFGMYEEVLPFVGVIVPMAIAMGYDSIVGVCIVYLSTTLGFAGAFFNPFTVGIAQGIAGLPLFSGFTYRMIVWVTMLGFGIAYVMRYAAKIKKNPHLSETFQNDETTRQKYLTDTKELNAKLSRKQILVLTSAGIAFAFLPIGVIHFKWGIGELTGLFFALGICSWLLGGLGFNKGIEAFIEGAREMVGAALLIGIARGIKIVLEDGLVMDTILFYLTSIISIFPKIIAVHIMFFVQCIMSLFLQSGSAQAAVSMPIMAPLSDLLGITRQTAILAFQLGDGFTNFAIPWNGITLAVLNLGLVPIWAWFKWAWKLQAWLIFVCMLLLVWPTLYNWGPF